MSLLIRAVKHSYTIRGIRETLQWFGLNGDKDCNSYVYCQVPEFIVAAALARATIGD
jgi:hypothetical protein